MSFDGLDADVKFIGNHLAGLAVQHAPQDFPLAHGQLLQLGANAIALFRAVMQLHRAPQRILDALKHLLRVIRLLHKIHGPVLQGPHGHRDVTVRRDKNSR